LSKAALGRAVAKRRSALQLALATLVTPSLPLAQQSRPHRLGLLAVSDESTTKLMFVDPFVAGMRERGYEIGRNLVLDVRHAKGDASRLPALAGELIALKPDVLLGIESAVRAMAGKTSTIPIVLIASSDPVAAGLVKSLARPGTNVTGMAMQFDALIAKQIELLAEIVPGMSRVGFLADDSASASGRFQNYARGGAGAKRLALTIEAAHEPESIRRAFAGFAKARAQGVVVASTGALLMHRRTIIDEAKRLRLPTMHSELENPRSGALASYGADTAASYRADVPPYVERILKGAKPAELAMQQPTKYVLVVNLKSAKEIGITIPNSILARADRVIE
jgi:putative ABC transport system substrate-binding protein